MTSPFRARDLFFYDPGLSFPKIPSGLGVASSGRIIACVKRHPEMTLAVL
jgi:hypothetical protein